MASIKDQIETILETIESRQAVSADIDAAGVSWVAANELGNIDLDELADVAPYFGYELFITREVIHVNGFTALCSWIRVEEV